MDGFLGTRGDFIVDLVITISGALPFLLLFTFWLAARGHHDLHRILQMILFATVLVLVIALELDVQMGGLADISAQSPYAGTSVYYLLFSVHLVFALTGFFGWLWLIIKSHKRYPKHFDFDHKKWGKLLFVDILLMAVTGWMLYWMTFAA